jgi:hypothetical protein
MKDRIEQYISAHRDAFDDMEPSPDLPDRILAAKAGTVGQKARRIPRTARVAATLAAGLLLALGLRVLHHNGADLGTSLTGMDRKTAMDHKTAMEDSDTALRLIDPVQAMQLEAISREAMTRQSELQTLQKDDPELYRRFLHDLALLDSNYRYLRSMLDQMPNQRQVMQAMEENLRTRLMMLEKQGRALRNPKQPVKSKS